MGYRVHRIELIGKNLLFRNVDFVIDLSLIRNILDYDQFHSYSSSMRFEAKKDKSFSFFLEISSIQCDIRKNLHKNRNMEFI